MWSLWYTRTSPAPWASDQIHPRDLLPSPCGLLPVGCHMFLPLLQRVPAPLHLDNCPEAGHTSNLARFGYNTSFSEPSADKDVKRQAPETQAALHGAPGHPPFLGGHGLHAPIFHSLPISSERTASRERDLLVWTSVGPSVHKSDPAARPKGWFLCVLYRDAERVVLHSSRSEVQKHRIALGLSSCLKGPELTVPLKWCF